MLASLESVVPNKTGKDSPAPAGCLFPFEETNAAVTVANLARRFPMLPPKIFVTLLILEIVGRSVTPFRLCACGCGEPVHGKADLASSACRKRVQRERDTKKADAPKQFGLVMQDNFNLKI